MILKNSVFYSTPKTACTWSRKAIIASGFFVRNALQKHSRFHESPKLHKYKSFCFVRNPVNWYASRWRSPGHRGRIRMGANEPYDIQNKDEELDLDLWTNRVIDTKALIFQDLFSGFSGGLMEPKQTAIGKFEDLREELIRCLEDCGEDVTEAAKTIIRNHPPENESNPELKILSRYRPETVKKIVVNNYAIFKMFGYPKVVSAYEHLFA